MEMQKNKAQEEAIETTDGQLLIIACPGSGKTTTLVRRIANMIKNGVEASSIIMMTFSRAAAREMHDRFSRQYPGLPQDTTFCTIHSFCFSIVKKYSDYDEDCLIDEYEVYSFFKKMLADDSNIQGSFSDFYKKLMLDIGNVKNRMTVPENVEPECTSDKEMFVALYNRYEKFKKQQGKIDFDDMLFVALDILQKDPALVRRLRKHYRYIQVDEYQDTNIVQAKIIYLLAGENGNLAVVGDDDQSIYGFRAATPEIMMNFTSVYPSAKIIEMGTNYRSKDEIISSANKVIKHNKKRFSKKFSGVNGKGGSVTLKYCGTSSEESRYVVDNIKAMIKNKGMPDSYEDVAVLFRKNTQAEPIAQELVKAGIPFHSTEKVRSRYEGFIYKDIQMFRHVATARPDEDIRKDLYSLLCKPMRFYKHGIENHGMDYVYMKRFISMTADENWKEKKGLEDLDRFFAGMRRISSCGPAEALKTIRTTLDYDRHLTKYAEFRNEEAKDYLEIMDQFEADVAGNHIETWEQWDRFAEKTILDFEKFNIKNGDAVTISTMHKSKGLEWDTVFMIGCSEDNIPGKNDSGENLEEERRLFYVAMTRAKRILKISYTGYKNESRFVKEITEKSQTDQSLNGRLASL